MYNIFCKYFYMALFPYWTNRCICSMRTKARIFRQKVACNKIQKKSKAAVLDYKTSGQIGQFWSYSDVKRNTEKICVCVES